MLAQKLTKLDSYFREVVDEIAVLDRLRFARRLASIHSDRSCDSPSM